MRLASDPSDFLNPVLLTVNVCNHTAVLTGIVADHLWVWPAWWSHRRQVIVFFVLAESLPKRGPFAQRPGCVSTARRLRARAVPALVAPSVEHSSDYECDRAGQGLREGPSSPNRNCWDRATRRC